MIESNIHKFNKLRQEYNVFTFERFDYVLNANEIRIKYTFNLSEKHYFTPQLIIHTEGFAERKLSASFLDNMIFNIGMIELISYWKAACPPVIAVKPRHLDEYQVRFWKKTYYHGLGEFFYLNGIPADEADFVKIESHASEACQPERLQVVDSSVVIPVGGGKDSAVTLELLKDEFHIVPFVINPRGATRESILLAGFDPDKILWVERTIDPALIELNYQGYLNGHTPFSAVVAFLSVLAAAITKGKFIALSNEASANEPTVSGGPNHQYSKSIEFESDFREYVSRYITPDIEYFSFLRPLHELGIAQIFSRYPRYFGEFKSCNVGSKDDKWCGHCPKCLFTAIILAPYISREEVRQIFGYDIFDNPDLVPLLESLTGIKENKPFECVGTIDEVNQALVLTIDAYEPDLPILLSHYKSTSLYMHHSPRVQGGQVEINDAHFLPEKFLDILKGHIHAEED